MNTTTQKAAVHVYLNDGTSYWTSVNPQMTDKELESYFVNTVFNFGTDGDLLKKCTQIEVERV